MLAWSQDHRRKLKEVVEQNYFGVAEPFVVVEVADSFVVVEVDESFVVEMVERLAAAEGGHKHVVVVAAGGVEEQANKIVVAEQAEAEREE